MKIISEKDEKILEKISENEEICEYMRGKINVIMLLYMIWGLYLIYNIVTNIAKSGIYGIIGDILFAIVVVMSIIQCKAELKKLKK